MKKTLLIVSILAVLSVLTVGIVMAHPNDPETPGYPGNPGYRGYQGGMMGGGYHGYGGGYMAEYMHAAIAEVLGITVEEFETRMYAGESMYNIALSLGFDAVEIDELHEKVRLEAFAQAYADGFIDEEHYNWMLERMNGSGGFGMYGGGYGMHGGGFARGGGGCHGYYQDTPSE